MSLRLLVCGGRAYRDWRRCFSILDAIDRGACIDLIIQGGQKTWDKDLRKYVGGADYYAHVWAKKTNCPEVEEPADWDRYQKRAGMIRNQLMLDRWSPTAVLAFPGGPGTRNMMSLSERAGLPVWTEDQFLVDGNGLVRLPHGFCPTCVEEV